jgi:hypothetical protein
MPEGLTAMLPGLAGASGAALAIGAPIANASTKVKLCRALRIIILRNSLNASSSR